MVETDDARDWYTCAHCKEPIEPEFCWGIQPDFGPDGALAVTLWFRCECDTWEEDEVFTGRYPYSPTAVEDLCGVDDWDDLPWKNPLPASPVREDDDRLVVWRRELRGTERRSRRFFKRLQRKSNKK